MAPEFDFDATFDPEVYLHFYGEFLDDERNETDADDVEAALALDAGDHVLDVPCGHGRLSNRLAARGYEVAGLDRSKKFLERARADAAERGVEVEYRLGDMRDLPYPDDSFDVAYNYFTSFGYFDDADDRQVLSEAARVVRPGGRFLVEMLHHDGLVGDFSEASVTRAGDDDGDLMVDEHDYDPVTGRIRTRRTAFVDGERHESTHSVRLYTAPELRQRFEDAGFDVTAVYGAGVEDLTLDSTRVLVVGEA